MYSIKNSPLHIAASEWITAQCLAPIIMTGDEMCAGIAAGKYTELPGGGKMVVADPRSVYEWHNWQYDHGWGAYIMHVSPANYARERGWKPSQEVVAAEREYYDSHIGGIRSASSDAAMESWEGIEAIQ